MGEDRLAKLDLIDRIQLSGVIQVCRECRFAAEAARKLFAASRDEKTNDSDRITKYLKQFGLHFSDCSVRS
jgi:transcriptional regulatory protein RtcR